MIHLVVRSLWEGPTGRRVRQFAAPALLAWFQEHWQRAAGEDGYLDGICGGNVYGFHTLFDREPMLAPPASLAELRERAESRLYVEGDPPLIDEHSWSVKTDDDEVDIAYFLFDDTVERADWMLHQGFELPADTSAAAFTPRAPVKALEPRGDGQGATWFVFLTGYDSSTFDVEGPRVLPGVRLPELCAHLRTVVPVATIEHRDPRQRPKDRFAAKFWRPLHVTTDWPRELLLLRSQLIDRDLEGALHACNQYPVGDFGGALIDDAGQGTLLDAAGSIESLRGKWSRDSQKAAESQFQITPHLAQMSMRLDLKVPAYHQWIIFDDLWAAAHPQLADGLLEWASRWDVLG